MGYQTQFAQHFFTSHYVPIKSNTSFSFTKSFSTFTSHYVPIKSYCHKNIIQVEKSLHPIMFLLNPKINKFICFVFIFTSHYVPIKSQAGGFMSKYMKYFTSHYVPIKSKMYCVSVGLQWSLHPIMFLLNPLV